MDDLVGGRDGNSKIRIEDRLLMGLKLNGAEMLVVWCNVGCLGDQLVSIKYNATSQETSKDTKKLTKGTEGEVLASLPNYNRSRSYEIR
jgi:hypothetical protein